MQPSSQDPTNPTGPSQSSFPSEPSSVPPQQDSISPTGQLYQLPPYAQTELPSIPPPPPSPSQGDYLQRVEYNQSLQDGGPITRYQARTQGKLDAPPRSGNGWKVISLILFILVLILATTTTALVLTHPSRSTQPPIGQATSTPASTQPVSTQPVSTQATQPTPTVSSNNYSATQPGPGCDTGGGTWTPQGPITKITCGTMITSSPTNTWGYLSLQLPGNRAFSANNQISITGDDLRSVLESGYNCLGLAEQDANTGFLGVYCGNGNWFIYSISNTGAIIQTLSQGITSTRTTEQLSLAIQGSTLSLEIDTEIHKVSISSLQPMQVAIAVSEPGDEDVSVKNFSYITPASL